MRATLDTKGQPDEMALSEAEGGWNNQKKEAWFEENIKLVCPIFEAQDSQLVLPFEKLMQLHKIMVCRPHPKHLDNRQTLLKANQNQEYRDEFINEAKRIEALTDLGYRVLNRMTEV